MTDSQKPNHWNSLASELGAEARADETRPAAAARVNPPVLPQRRQVAPVPRSTKPTSDWDILATDLGLQPLPPRPKASPPPVMKTPPPKPPAPKPVERAPVIEHKDIPERQLAVEKSPEADQPVAELEMNWSAKDEDIDFVPEAAEADAESGGESSDEEPRRGGRKRRRRRRGGRKSDESGRKESAASESEPDLFAPPTDDNVESAVEPDAIVSLESEAVAGESVTEEEPTEREGRPRRRRRRRGGRRNGKAPSAESAATEDNTCEDELTPSLEMDQVVHESSDRAEEDDEADEDDEEDSDLEGDASTEDGDDDEVGADDSRDMKSHRSIPSWADAIGSIIALNMEARAKNPSQGSGAPRGRGWGRGGRGRSGNNRR